MKDKSTEDTRFYLSSCSSDAEFLLNCTRKHCQVENQLHWTLDVTFSDYLFAIDKATFDDIAIKQEKLLTPKPLEN